MAEQRGFSWGAACVGALAVVVLIVVVGAAIVFGGIYPVGASSPHSAGVGWLISETRDRSIARSASGLATPQFSPADIRLGASHFKGMCQGCHGGPGVKPDDFATAMNPRPPDLARTTDDLSVTEVFWIAKNGLKMTGMPAFGKTDEDDELWKVAAFVKSMSTVRPSDYASIPNAHAHEGGEEGVEKTGDKDGHSH